MPPMDQKSLRNAPGRVRDAILHVLTLTTTPRAMDAAAVGRHHGLGFPGA